MSSTLHWQLYPIDPGHGLGEHHDTWDRLNHRLMAGHAMLDGIFIDGLLRHFGGGRYEVLSAGTNPTSLRPEAVEVMREAGIDISGQKSKSLEEYIGQDFDYVITVCSKAKESCPVFPGDTDHIAWDFDDPAEVQGSEETRMHEFRRVRDEIHQRLSLFMSADHR